VEPDTAIRDAAHLMAERKIGCLPVLSEGSLVGLVTTTDILRYVEALGMTERADLPQINELERRNSGRGMWRKTWAAF
jgi:CBS domain-containing protein